MCGSCVTPVTLGQWLYKQKSSGPPAARYCAGDVGGERGAWDDWEIEVEDYLDAGERVVVLLHQRGRAKVTGIPVEMRLGQVWTIEDGKSIWMQMYASPEEALEAAGLPE
jgi:SnoaL-like domain